MSNKKCSYFVEYSFIYYEFITIEEDTGYEPVTDFNCGLFYCTYDEIQKEVENRVIENYIPKNIKYKDLKVNIINCYFSSDLNQLDLPKCSKCGNTDIFVKRGMMADLYVCRKCGHEWR